MHPSGGVDSLEKRSQVGRSGALEVTGKGNGNPLPRLLLQWKKRKEKTQGGVDQGKGRKGDSKKTPSGKSCT